MNTKIYTYTYMSLVDSEQRSRGFFSIWVFLYELSRIHELQYCRQKGMAFLLPLHYHFHLPQRHLDITQVITAESPPSASC